MARLRRRHPRRQHQVRRQGAGLLDRQIDDAYKAALARQDKRGVAELRREQRAFIARRDRAFGDPDYQIKREFERRLKTLQAAR